LTDFAFLHASNEKGSPDISLEWGRMTLNPSPLFDTQLTMEAGPDKTGTPQAFTALDKVFAEASSRMIGRNWLRPTGLESSLEGFGSYEFLGLPETE
jgi:hypothetical protein